MERRRTISAASLGLLETMRCWRSRSYQRNAGIPSFVPWRIPAWLPEVIDGSIASHWESRWLPSRIQPAIVLTEPARTRAARIGWARPSIWMITSPGLSDFGADRLAMRLETKRPKYDPSRSTPRIAVSSVLKAANTNDPIRAEKNPSTSTPCASGAITRNVRTCRTRTRTPSSSNEREATNVSRTGRMMALKRAMRTTATTASRKRPI